MIEQAGLRILITAEALKWYINPFRGAKNICPRAIGNRGIPQ